jgi:hypothetical protein
VDCAFYFPIVSTINQAPIRGAFFTKTETYTDSTAFDGQLFDTKVPLQIASLHIRPISPTTTYSYSNPIVIRYRGLNKLAALTLPIHTSGICNDNEEPSSLF